MTRRFTGGHMLALMLAFFGTVVAVNFVMATLAVRTFGGTVVDNSYVASQHYNHWLDQARAQRALGWTASLALDPDRHVEAAVGERGRPLDGAVLSAVAMHPLGHEVDFPLRFADQGNGRYRSLAPLPPGRWILRFTIARGSDRARLIETLQ
jgi:nitrogen fixation protein FixH